MKNSFWDNFTLQTKGNLVLVFLLGATLPFKDIYSTITLILLVLLSVYFIIKNRDKESALNTFGLLFIPGLLIIPRIVGLFTGNLNGALDEIIRALPFVLIPFVFLTWTSYKNIEKSFYFGVLAGLLFFMIICEYVVVIKMINGDEPLEYFFRWRHLNVNFVKPLETHPPYVAILIIWLFVKTINKNYLVKKLRYILLAVLALFLFQLLARNAILIAVLVALYYSIRKLNFKQIVLVAASTALLLTVVIYHPDDYLRNKILNSLNPFDDENRDKRITRLSASIEVFKLAPIFGVGPKNDNELRKIEYKKRKDYTASKNNYNSHNQFFEYLVSHGIIGLLCFTTVLWIVIRITLKNKDYDNLLLVICFIIACLTESLLERSLGIKYFSILVAFILLKHLERQRQTLLEYK